MSLRDKLPKISFKRVVQAIKSPTFLGFSLVSAALTLYLYWNSGSETYERVLLAVTAFSLEGLKLYALLVGNIYMDYIKIVAKERGLKVTALLRVDDICKSVMRAAVGMYVVYILAAAVSIFGSYNFTLSAVDKTVRINQAQQTSLQSPEMIKLSSQIAFYDKEIIRLQAKIDQNTADWKSYGPDFQSIKDRIDAKINKDTLQQSDYEKKKTDDELALARLQADAAGKTADIKKTSFQIMAEAWSTDSRKVTEQNILMVLFLLTSVLIELGLIVTSPHEDTFGIFKKVSSHTDEPKPLPLPDEPVIAPVKKTRKKKSVVLPNEHNVDAVKDAAKKASEVSAPLVEEVSLVDLLEANVTRELKSQPEPAPKRVEVKDSPVFTFLKNILPEDGLPGFIRKENISLEPAISNIQAKEIFNNLQRAKGPTGYPVFEFRKDHGKWFSNYSLNDIVEMFSKGSLYI